MESNKRIPLSPGYHAEPGPTPGHQHDIYTTAPPFEGGRRHVGTLSKAAVEAWASSSAEMATALLFALEHEDDKDVADFLRDWMRGDTSRWFEFTAKYRKALAETAEAARLRAEGEDTAVVPLEPTVGMQEDGLAALEAAIRTHGKPSLPGFAAAHVYCAMVAARPSTEKEDQADA